MSKINLNAQDAFPPVRRLGIALRTSAEHPGFLALYTFRDGAQEIDLETQAPAHIVGPRETFSVELDERGLVVAVCPIVDDEPQPGESTTLTRGDISWVLEGRPRVGRFVNGDWWVKGPARVLSISPGVQLSGSRVMNGSMLNPRPTLAERTGVDSAIGSPMRYDDALNIGRRLPIDLLPGNSLCSTVSFPTTGQEQVTRFAAVLTCVQDVEDANAFRPMFTGGTSARWSAASLDLTSLSSLVPVAAAPSPAALFPRIAQIPWGDTTPGWIATKAFAPANSPTYGRDISSLYGECALALHLDYPEEEKRDLLIALIQRGIDLYGILMNGGRENWLPNGGHASGRKWPILFAGIMLEDPDLIAAAQNPANAFGEDWQTFTVEETSPGVYNQGYGGYGAQHVGMPEWGIRHRWMAQHDNVSEFAPYRDCCTANSWGGAALSARLMDAIWGWDAFQRYYDRYMRQITRAYGTDYWKRDWTARDNAQGWIAQTYDRYFGEGLA